MSDKFCYIVSGNPYSFRRTQDGMYRLLEEVVYNYCGRRIKVQAGFIYDLASVPKIVQGILGKKEKLAIEACLLHDFIYKTHTLSRKDGDLAFFLLMKRYNNPESGWKRWVMWKAVQLFGEKPYRIKS